ncbi:MAG TPA: sigma-54 dependent transcriptional regulator [Verrucomicrobiota bacterium]|nr:sigma-54 dependent transcriptional regulator [Verrucomicrobiota bacterium]HOP97613.1 sigma-54 dependent transcriptional regulator [Verrucomicrobiota bacterium]HPU56686.1 sigma-54 dependent transcriptional regulator [Verrucomicrobiota bacterium]
MPSENLANHGEMPRILIVDDDPGQRSLLNSFLQSQGFETVLADSGERALEALRTGRFDMMISDVRMPGMSGLDTLRAARKEHATLPVLLVTAFTDVRDAVAAMRDGAVNYLAKPIDLEELLASVQQATGVSQSVPLKYADDKQLPEYVIARSPLMQAVFREASLIAPSDTRVLITGESGVGKEVVADVIHAWSTRAKGPLVKVNCAAIPETLLESELFGHEKGAFTGAHAQRIGRFEEASEGTIFLDEIAEMSPQLQAKLLRVTQNGTFQRVGSNRELRTGARILTATNRNLEELVKAGKFREDLFYRLNVVELNIPPLRERREDILPLASHFIAELAKGRARFSEAVTECLQRYPWPGNVRELRNAMERAVLLSRSELILPEHLPSRVRELAGQAPAPANGDARQLEEIERQAILQALRQHNYNRTETAKALGISRRALIYKLQRFRKMGFEIDPV